MGCNVGMINDVEVTVFTNRHACRLIVVLYHHIKTSYLRIYPIASEDGRDRGVIGLRLEILGCIDNGKQPTKVGRSVGTVLS